MTNSTDSASTEQTFADVERALVARWPETRIDPTLDRMAELVDLLGHPERAYPVIHLTGTNGKTSTARMIDALVRALGLRTGRFTSPHLESITERICLDGEPISREGFVEAYREIEPFVDLVSANREIPLSFFEVLTGMAFAAFADAPIDAAILEVGMGGSWDNTNVADASVAVVTPIGVDHAQYLGDTPEAIAAEKGGIIKPGSIAVLAEQPVPVAEVLLERVAEVGAVAAREGIEFGVVDRVPAVDGQMVQLRGLHGTYDDVFLPLHGAHQAHNAAYALAAVEAFAAGAGEAAQGLDIDLVRQALAQVSSPGRLEVARRSPTVLLDAAHNPHGAAALAEAVGEAFAITPVIGVLGVMSDKDVEGLLDALEPLMHTVVVTQNSFDRCLPAEELGDLAAGVFGPDRVVVEPRLDNAIERAITLAEEGLGDGVGYGSGGVVVTGSVITVGEARQLLTGGRP